MTTATESLFYYGNGLGHADYSFPDFVPKFIDEANETLVANATDFCGEGNNQCIYDFVITGNRELALATNITEAEAVETKATASMNDALLSYCMLKKLWAFLIFNDK